MRSGRNTWQRLVRREISRREGTLPRSVQDGIYRDRARCVGRKRQGTGALQNAGTRRCHPSQINALVVMCLVLFSSAFAPAQETDAGGRPDMQSFRIITQRNIFNPNRSSRRERTRTEAEVERRVRTDSVALLGTMNYEKGWVAFFDGSSPDYRKALQPGDTIADHKIGEIAANYVKLESGTNHPIDLKVGSEMKRQDEGTWEIKDRIEASVASSSPMPPADTNATDGESDIIKRLMQQREQELQK